MVEGSRIIPEQYRGKISEAQTREERHKALLEARKEIYRTAYSLRGAIIEHGRNVNQEQLSQELQLTEQQSQILESTCEVLHNDAERCNTLWEQFPKKEGQAEPTSEWIEAFLGKSPDGIVTINNLQDYGCLEINCANIFDLNGTSLHKPKPIDTEKPVPNAEIWGEAFPITPSYQSLSLGFYRPPSSNNDAPVIVIGPQNSQHTKEHELGHHINTVIQLAQEATIPGSGIVTKQDLSMAREAFYYREQFFGYGTTPKFLEDLSNTINTIRDGFLEVARDEISTDFKAQGTLAHINNLLPGGHYDYFVDEFNERIHTYPVSIQKLLKQNREEYYETLTANCIPLRDAYEKAEENDDIDMMRIIIGITHSTPLSLWARRLAQIAQ